MPLAMVFELCAMLLLFAAIPNADGAFESLLAWGLFLLTVATFLKTGAAWLATPTPDSSAAKMDEHGNTYRTM